MTKILVLGGTGMLGAPVARQLVADGLQVRLMARDPQKAQGLFDFTGRDHAAFEIVQGDVTDLDSLEKAMEGCDGAHVSIAGPAERPAAENVAALAAEKGLERITYVSGSTVFEQNRWFPMVEQKLMAEVAVRECGVPYTVFCPTWPMEQLPRFAQGERATVIGAQLPPWHWFAAADMARMVSTAYQREEAANKRLFVHGPEALTATAALERYCRAFHPEIESVSVMPIDAAKAVAESTGNDFLRLAAELMGYFEKVGEMGDPTEANELLGAPTTTLDAWIESGKQA
jgi:uncharacterized protein YbjT (DUF2867 family)